MIISQRYIIKSLRFYYVLPIFIRGISYFINKILKYKIPRMKIKFGLLNIISYIIYSYYFTSYNKLFYLLNTIWKMTHNLIKLIM